MHSLAFILSMFVAPATSPPVVTIPEVTIVAPAVKGTSKLFCGEWKNSAVGGQYKDCTVMYADGKGNWINPSYDAKGAKNRR